LSGNQIASTDFSGALDTIFFAAGIQPAAFLLLVKRLLKLQEAGGFYIRDFWRNV
jgi:hypothetical protein